MDECARCEQPMSYEDWVRDPVKQQLRNQVKRLKDWLGPCPDCGMVCGRHDANTQHLPF